MKQLTLVAQYNSPQTLVGLSPKMLAEKFNAVVKIFDASRQIRANGSFNDLCRLEDFLINEKAMDVSQIYAEPLEAVKP